MAADMVRAGSASHVLVIGVERLSDLTDLYDRGTAFIFADGAGAVVVGPSDTPGIGPVVWGSDGEQFDLIRQREDWRDVVGAPEKPGSGLMPHLVMQGNPVFRWAVCAMAKVAAAGARRGRASPPTSSTSSCPTRPTCASSTRWPSAMKLPDSVRDRPRHRRPGQHLGGLDPPRPRPDDRRG